MLAGASMKTSVSDLGLAPLTRRCVILRLKPPNGGGVAERLTCTGVVVGILECNPSMGSTSSQSESQPPTASRPLKPWKPFRLCGTLPTSAVPAEHYVEQLWATSDATSFQVWRQVQQCSDTPVGQGGTLNLVDLTIMGASAPKKKVTNPPGVPPPPEYLPEMKDAEIVKDTIHALSPRIVAVHGPTGTGKATVFPLAIAHWTERKLKGWLWD